MATYTRKDVTVEAIQHVGSDLNVTSFLKGDQVAHAGDFLVVDKNAQATIKAQGGTSNRGAVYVVSKADFLRDFNAPDDTVVPVLVGGAALDFSASTDAKPAPAPAK